MKRYYSKRSPKKKSKKRLFILMLLILGLGYYFFLRPSEEPKQAVLSSGAFVGTGTESFAKEAPANSLEEAVNKALEGSKGTYSIVIKNLKTGESYLKDEDREYAAGSLYKLWVMGESFSQIEEGILSEDENLSQDIEVLNEKFNIDPDLAEQKTGTISETVGEALTQMITISHNYSALLLSEKLKLSQVAEYIEKNGFNNSSVGTDGNVPVTTASDIALFFEKLVQGDLGNSENTARMISLLKQQKLNNKLPQNLPGIAIAHKTGEIGVFSHDAGIVYSPKGEYIIVVLSESNDPKGANTRIANLSENVFEFFNK